MALSAEEVQGTRCKVQGKREYIRFILPCTLYLSLGAAQSKGLPRRGLGEGGSFYSLLTERFRSRSGLHACRGQLLHKILVGVNQ
jgi:hypothetical protein